VQELQNIVGLTGDIMEIKLSNDDKKEILLELNRNLGFDFNREIILTKKDILYYVKSSLIEDLQDIKDKVYNEFRKEIREEVEPTLLMLNTEIKKIDIALRKVTNER
jgi:hypothetical protein